MEDNPENKENSGNEVKPEHHSGHKSHPQKAHGHKHAHKTKAHSAKAEATDKTSYAPYIIGAVAVLAIIIALVLRLSTDGPATKVENPGKYGSVPVVFHVMSQCPYGTQVEDGIYPVLKDFGQSVDFRLEFIAGGDAQTGFQSLHGEEEVAGDKIQLCVQEHYPDKLMDFVKCQNKDAKDLQGSVDSCSKEVGIEASKVKTCYKGSEGSELLEKSIEASIKANAQGSPTMFFDGQLYNGGRDKISFTRAICAGLEGHPLCENIPVCAQDTDCTAEPGKVGVCENAGDKDAKCTYKDDAEVSLTVLNSKECASCDSTELETVLSRIFLNMDIKRVDASSTEGKALIKQYGLQFAPSYIFSDLSETAAWKSNPRIQGAFKEVGTKYVMIDEASGSSYLLDPAKRQELEEKTGIVKGDNKPQIDFYVMSYCPYGNMAEEGIEPVYQLLKDNAAFNPHYVIYSNYQGGGAEYCMDAESLYCSMHGVQEMNQNIRELCVNKYMGIDKYFEFVLAMNEKCTAQNADSCWKAVADDLNLDRAKIAQCEEDEGEALAAKELELNNLLGVRGSPTIFVEGQQYSGSRDPQGYASALCAGFEDAPSECGKISTLEGSAQNPASAGGGCG